MLICDDDPERAERWARTIRAMPGVSRFSVQPLTGGGLARAVESLNRRRQDARSAEGQVARDDDATVFDEAAIAVIDYDLTPNESTLKNTEGSDDSAEAVRQYLRGRVGESIAYQARCFTSVGFLVVVNQRFQEQTFDVTMQRFSDSSADLNVTQADLANPALWSGRTASNQFHPWSWPILSEADHLWERRAAATSLDDPVLRSLGLEDDIESFSPRQLDLLAELTTKAEDQDLKAVTFNDVVSSALGLDVRDVQTDTRQRQYIAASVVSRWLEQIVLPSQNVVTDLPHIVARFPAILEDGPAADVMTWATLALKGESQSIPPFLRELTQVCEGYSSKPVWSARTVRGAVGRKAFPEDLPELVFCEDTSRFVQIEDSREVETDVAGPHNRRFIEQVPNVRYDPLRRVL